MYKRIIHLDKVELIHKMQNHLDILKSNVILHINSIKGKALQSSEKVWKRHLYSSEKLLTH